MAYATYGLNFVADHNERIALFEEKLTNEQLQYLHQYYQINKHAGPKQIREIAKQQWNNNDFDFFMDLINWFHDQHLEDIIREQRRFFTSSVGA